MADGYNFIETKTGRLGYRPYTDATIDINPPSAWVTWRDGSNGTVALDDMLGVPAELYEPLCKMEDAVKGLQAMPRVARALIAYIMVDMVRDHKQRY